MNIQILTPSQAERAPVTVLAGFLNPELSRTDEKLMAMSNTCISRILRENLPMVVDRLAMITASRSQ
ncbi:hypothetical protein [Nitrosomonas sp. HPC101]|uniref:hypothetical protein n=1 Tax=Nitrosomonas sp. HPC101 TaxID=1658667 RepID=UPI0013714C8A|nr:hypothetical protein [Nitrosomonas sp. HPC101]